MGDALTRLGAAAAELAAAASAAVAPFVPLLAWAAFWYFAVDWHRLRPLLFRGGAVVVTAVLAIAVAAFAAVDPVGVREFGPVPVSSPAYAAAWAAALTAVALLAGAAQVSRRERLTVRRGE